MDQRRMLAILTVAMMLATLLAGCTIQPEEKGEDTIKVKDGLDREVKVKVGGDRVISIAPSCTEILYSLGLGPKVVAVDNNTNYPPEAMDRPKVSGYKWLDMETILGLDPDIIFGANINKEMVPQLEERGLTVVILSPTDIAGIFEDIRLVGRIMGIERTGEELTARLEGRVEDVTEKTLASGVDRPRTYIELDAFMGYFTYGPDTFGDELIRLSGGENIAGKETIQYPMLADEFIIASDPEVIIYQLGPWTTTTPDGIRARTGWGNVTAVRKDILIGVDGDWISRPGPRIVDGLEAIAKAIHPELVTG